MTYVSYEYLSVDWEIRRDVLELNFSDSMVDLSEWYDCLGDGLLNGGG
jgi:hypothetical protein